MKAVRCEGSGGAGETAVPGTVKPLGERIDPAALRSECLLLHLLTCTASCNERLAEEVKVAAPFPSVRILTNARAVVRRSLARSLCQRGGGMKREGRWEQRKRGRSCLGSGWISSRAQNDEWKAADRQTWKMRCMSAAFSRSR